MRRIATLPVIALLVVIAAGATRKADPRDQELLVDAKTVDADQINNTIEARPIYRLSEEAKQQIQTALPQSRLMLMEVTAYCPCQKCCGKGAHGVTASGQRITQNNGEFVAADTTVLPFNTKLVIPGYSNGPVEVLDRGGAIKGNKLDVFFPTHDQAKQWGRRWIEVVVVPRD